MKRLAVYILIGLQAGTWDPVLFAGSGGKDDICLGYIDIAGSTNVSHFTISSELSSVHVPESRLHDLPSDNALIEIPVPLEQFRAGNRIMYQDFLELMKASVYPQIFIGVGYPQLIRILNYREDIVSDIEITMAGVTNEYSIPFHVVNCSDEHVHIIGKRMIRLTEFNLEPPEKFQGLVKVNDLVLINFGIVVELQPDIILTGFEGKH